MHNFVREMRATLIIRGSKSVDARRGPEGDGALLDGVEFLLPVAGWSHEQVFGFLRAEGVEIPEHYSYGATSLDCIHCTAFLDEYAGKMRFMRERHAAKFEELQRRLREIRNAVTTDLSALDDCILG
jgi:phosphoadenosine phosphosulfate reductase